MLGELIDPRTGQPVDVRQYLEKFYWDRRSLGASITAGTTYNFFSREGGTDDRDTNMLQASQFPAGTEVIVGSIQITPPGGTTLADQILLVDNGWIYVYEGTQQTFQSPLQHCPGGTGIAGMTTRTATDVVTLGTPNPMAVVPMSTPPIIDRQTTYQVRMNFPDATTLAAARVVEIASRCLVSRRLVG
jgi:hypothetical protein